MTRYLLDTNHASPLVTPGHPLRTRFDTETFAGAAFFLCPVVRSETRFGLLTTPRAAENLREWDRLSARMTAARVRPADADLAADLRLFLRVRGRQFELADSLIAAVALRLNLTLLTRDRDFAAVPHLRTADWLAP